MTPASGATPAESLTPVTPQSDDIALTPKWLRIGASWGWRFLVIAAVTVVLWQIGARLSLIVVPLILAVLFTSGLSPFAEWLISKGWPRWLGSLTALLSLVLVILGLLFLVGAQVALQSSQLVAAATEGVKSLLSWLATGPLQISDDQVNQWINQIVTYAQQSSEQIASGLASAGSTVGSFFAGLATCLFATFFFLKDGHRIVNSFERIIPTHAVSAIEPSMRGGWTSLTSYVRAAVIVAGIDGIGAGLGALFLGSNLWLAITAFTFVCSFVPLLGALVAGTVATLVVLVTLGFVKAIIMLIVFVLVMSIESHVLQPLVLGKAVEIHPLIVLLGISAGAIIAGITGALFAIPLVAFVNGCIKGAELDEAERARRSRGLSLPRSRPEASGSPFRWGRRGAKLDA
ncbi:MAG: AI-2E family transporter [Propionibacterium sp.]|uniref:AI-2E family transporter n=1 Tax=Brooklawnia propionicigenes TaxID=3041175 RepID=A0AAN0K7F3_9ACTN|nr:AI-2E family transporter [Brooklawnia sp. SH051]NLI85370.1 AI-2E family transporter [Propionibacterium sp.]BEH01446.1 AI-2E family transporter [Brooklawnia sp. SH051]